MPYRIMKHVEEKDDVIFASWLLDILAMDMKETLFVFEMYSDRLFSRDHYYEMSWSNVGNIVGYNQVQVYNHIQHSSRYIQFCLKKLYKIDFKKDRDVIPDCWESPQTVWVSIDGGKFRMDGSNQMTSKIILKKVKNVSSFYKTKYAEECWKSDSQTVFTPQSRFKQFNFKFCLQFKTSSFNRMNASIVEQATFLQQTNCDVHFRFQSTSSDQIGAHRCILSVGSPVFAAMFRHNMQESETGEVFIQDIERDIFYQLLHFIYSGRISDPLTESTAQQLLTAADKYDIQDLKKECASFLLPYVNETNAQKMFELADAFHVKNLKEECERILIVGMEITKVLDLIIWADLHSAEKVKKAALDFTRANKTILFRYYNYEDEKLKLMRQYFLRATCRRMTM